MSVASERRYAKMNDVFQSIMNTEGVMVITDKAQIAQMIRELKAFGKTERWVGRVEQWAGMVEEATDEKSLRWGFLQGSIYASHAAG